MLNRQIGYKTTLNILTVFVCMALVLSCGPHKKATVAFSEGRYDNAIAEYRKTLHSNPKDLKALIGLRRALPLSAEKHLVKAKEAKNHGRYQEELTEVGIALMLDPNNAIAADWLANLDKLEIERRNMIDRGQSINSAHLKIRSEANVLPAINPRSLDGLDLNFTRKTELREIFRHLSKNSGVNIIMHSSVVDKSMPVSIDLRGLTFQRLLDVLMMQSDLFYKVLDANSIMVFSKGDASAKEYGQRLVQTFYLSNAKVDKVKLVISKVLPNVKTIHDDLYLNTITIIAKPNEIEVAKRIVDQLDKARAEVVIYLELIEVFESAMSGIGITPENPLDALTSSGKLPYSIGASKVKDAVGYLAASSSLALLPNGGGAGVGEDKALSSLFGSNKFDSHKFVSITPGLRLELAKQNGDAKILANPNIRVISSEKGTINIGDEIAVTKDTIGLMDGDKRPNIKTEYIYKKVGINIEVMPFVHINKDISVELKAEIASLKPSESGSNQPNVSARNITTKVRLRDGEQALFAGFLKEEEKKTLRGIWGLSDIPILGKLFTHRHKEKTKTDIVLSLRAVLVRAPDLQASDLMPFDPDAVSAQTKPFDPIEVSQSYDALEVFDKQVELKLPQSLPSVEPTPLSSLSKDTDAPLIGMATDK